jgi:TolB-like protein/DNA-binding CsgD family transcriptional regulator
LVPAQSTNNRPPASPADLGLSGKQVEVLALLMQGKSNKAICRALDLAEPTVKYHITTILKALKVTNRTEAVLAVGKLGWKLPAADNEGRSAERSASTEAPAAPSEPASATEARLHASGRLAAGETKPAMPLPDKPSVVVLPFINLSGDPSQDYFADGMVEDITISLGRYPWLFVIASTSAFVYKGRAVDARQIGADLGVRYLLGGSVRKDGNRVRITAQLTDALRGSHIWAERFEGEIDGIFALQDRVANYVSTATAPALRTYEIGHAARKPTNNLTAYDLFLRALPVHQITFERNQESLRLLHQAIELDPSYASAYGFAAWCYSQQRVFGWVLPSDPPLSEGIRLANKAAELTDNDGEALWMAAYTLTLVAGEFDRSLALAEKSISLNTNSADAWWISGTVRMFLDDTETALDHLARARRLNPLDPLSQSHWMSIALAQFFAGRFQDASDAAEKSLADHPNYPPALRMKVVTSGLLGRLDEGRSYVRQLLGVNPNATMATLRAYYEPLMRRNARRLDDYLKGLRLSGMPEG